MKLACLLVLLCTVAFGQSGLRSPVFVSSLHPNGPPNNCDSVNDSSLKGYWKLDEASGNAIDAKGVNTLTDNNSVGTGVGKISTGRDFTGASSQFLSSADNAALSMGDIDFTIGAWVRYAGTLGALQYPAIMGKWVLATTKEYNLYLNGDSTRFEFSVSGDGTTSTTVTANTFGAPVNDTWYHVVAWHDATANTISISVNAGTPDSAAHTTGVVDSTSAFQIGAFDGAFFWTGQIDEAFLTKRVLTAGERTSLYNVGVGCRPSGL